MPGRKPANEQCRNCGNDVLGARYCSRCGQENSEKILSFGEMLCDVRDEFLKYDVKLLNTLRLLIFQPGKLTLEYVSGRRVRYITPLRLYFMLSALFFWVYTATGFDRKVMKDVTISTVRMSAGTVAPAPSAQEKSELRDRKRLRSPTASGERIVSRLMAVQTWMIANMSNILLLFIPLTAMVLKLLYLKSGRTYVEHLVFSAHISAFSYLCSLPGLLLQNMKLYNGAFLLFEPIYFIIAMKRVYGQSIQKTLLKGIVALVAPMLAYVLLVVLSMAAIAIYTAVFNR